MPKTETIDLSIGKNNTNLGEYRGNATHYLGLSIDGYSNIIGESDTVKTHIKTFVDSNNTDINYIKTHYLETINVEITDTTNSVDLNLFHINYCDNGKFLELHIAIGKQLNSTKTSRTYTSSRELILHATKPESFQIKFVVYNYKKGNEIDLYFYPCKTATRRKIDVYDELADHDKGMKLNKFIKDDGKIDPKPDTKKGSIIIGG